MSDAPLLDVDAPVVDATGNKLLFASPGARIRTRGRRLSPESAVSDDPEGVDSLLGISVLVGEQSARLVLVPPTEIVVILPPDLPLNSQVALVVVNGNLTSAPELVLVVR